MDIEWTPDQIRAFRHALRRSPLEFARMVGITKRTLVLWESGRTSSPQAASKRLLFEVLEAAPEDVRIRFRDALVPNASTAPQPRPDNHDLLMSCADESENTAASWRGDYGRAAEAATDGLSYPESGTARLLLASARAIDLAQLGNTSESASALDEALDIAARLLDEPQRDRLAGPFSCSLERAGGYWADAALANGNATQSVVFTAAAIDRFRRAAPSHRNLGSERMVRCQQIKSYVALGEFGAAAIDLADVTATTPVEHRVEPLVQRVGEIAELAQNTGRNAQGVAEIGELARDFRRFADLGNLPTLLVDPHGR
ncbi:helix-turn-helix domain-containing protein [Nocardia wallacei]|uniref:helix-turn-helix domain-containing protein n=1 Tax=Nocardia wallacei TaxID=480035 RepID=UPI0024591109|nr:hypothetical protein [Nocardia wallacei]